MSDLPRSRRVLVTGGGGYVGSHVCRELLVHGFGVLVVDRLLFGDASVRELAQHEDVSVLRLDVRDRSGVAAALREVDAVVHLAALVGEPACALDERLAFDTNVAATQSLLDSAAAAGVRRFVFASTCSVYGPTEESVCERAPLRPLGVYGRSKAEAERIALERAGADLAVVALRFATLHGLSARPRLDLVVNTLAARAVREGRIWLRNPEQWRPFLHVHDAARAVLRVLKAPAAVVSGEVFNAGSDSETCRFADVAELIRAAVPGVVTDESRDDEPTPGYRVSFAKISEQLGFAPKRSLRDGIAELVSALESGALGPISEPEYSNLETLRRQLPALQATVQATGPPQC